MNATLEGRRRWDIAHSSFFFFWEAAGCVRAGRAFLLIPLTLFLRRKRFIKNRKKESGERERGTEGDKRRGRGREGGRRGGVRGRHAGRWAGRVSEVQSEKGEEKGLIENDQKKERKGGREREREREREQESCLAAFTSSRSTPSPFRPSLHVP